MTTGTSMAPAKTFPKSFYGLMHDPMREFQNRMSRLFGENFGLMVPEMEENWSLATWAPACDIYETEHEFVVKAELPEVKKEDVKVSFENNVLTIRGERKFEEETKKENYHRIERRYGDFMRSFTLPNVVDMEKIVAEFKDGMLQVKLPKRPEVKPKNIDVKVG